MSFMLCTPVIGEQDFIQEKVLIVELLTISQGAGNTPGEALLKGKEDSRTILL